MRAVIVAGLMALMFATATAGAAEKLPVAEKALLYAAMQQSIDHNLVDGRYLHFDAATAKVQALYPAKTHPMIMRMGEYFVLCTDFRTGEGLSVNVDFYVSRGKGSFFVFDKVVDNRAPIKRLMKNGLIKMVP